MDVKATTGKTCTCELFGKEFVVIEGNESARLASCEYCRRNWFRPHADVFAWRRVLEEEELAALAKEFEVVVI